MSMECPICKHKGNKIFDGMILGKYQVAYFQCLECGLIYTETPYWLEEAYDEAIVGTDTGLLQRNFSFSITTNVLINRVFQKRAKYLDYGGGYGVFVSMMRDLGHDFMWKDKHAQNLVAKGFEYTDGEIELLTAFELFEHFEKPKEEIENLISLSKNILFSTTLYGDDYTYPQLDDWWYYAPHAGQHIVFYSEKTLQYMAHKYDLHYYKINNNLHLFTKAKIKKSKEFFCKDSIGNKCYQYISWFWNKKNALCVNDMEKILQENKNDNIR